MLRLNVAIPVDILHPNAGDVCAPVALIVVLFAGFTNVHWNEYGAAPPAADATNVHDTLPDAAATHGVFCTSKAPLSGGRVNTKSTRISPVTVTGREEELYPLAEAVSVTFPLSGLSEYVPLAAVVVDLPVDELIATPDRVPALFVTVPLTVKPALN